MPFAIVLSLRYGVILRTEDLHRYVLCKYTLSSLSLTVFMMLLLSIATDLFCEDELIHRHSSTVFVWNLKMPVIQKFLLTFSIEALSRKEWKI